jgi:hypothetical protein
MACAMACAMARATACAEACDAADGGKKSENELNVEKRRQNDRKGGRLLAANISGV